MRSNRRKGYEHFPKVSSLMCFFFVLQNHVNREKVGTASSHRIPHSAFVVFSFFWSNEAASTASKLLIYYGQSSSQAH